MENKIEVGEYVRTKRGIAKVTNIDDLDNVAWTDKKGIYFGVTRKSGYLDWYIYDDGTVLKHSKNIIKLIKQGDYVNGYEVITVYGYDENGNDKDGLGICEVDDDYAYYTYLEDIDIKSIVTKEQFDSVKYITKEEK